MSSCKTLVRTSLETQMCTRSQRHFRSISLPIKFPFISVTTSTLPRFAFLRSPNQHLPSTIYTCLSATAVSTGQEESTDTHSINSISVPQEDGESSKDTVTALLKKRADVAKLPRMERRTQGIGPDNRWFPYLDIFKSGDSFLTSGEVLEALDPYIFATRKERFRKIVEHRSYSVCLVVEGLSDIGNVSAAFRSADALGIQSVHVVSPDSTKRYKEHRHVSMGAEKWLDIELWNSAQECFKVLKSRGYRIATTHLGMETVSIYDMSWSCPTAIVVGNEGRGISEEALLLSDLHCSIPMKGMVDSFNVSVAAGILMHHAVCDRTSRLGFHGDLTLKESQILLAEFSLRHSRSAISIAHEFAKRKVDRPIAML